MERSRSSRGRRTTDEPGELRRIAAVDYRASGLVSKLEHGKIVKLMRDPGRSTKHPVTDDETLLDTIAQLVAAIVGDDQVAAGTALERLRFALPPSPGRPAVPHLVYARVWTRDHFTCRYCSIRTIPSIVLQVISAVAGEAFPYHPNWKSDSTHPAYWRITTSLDHTVAGTSGGSWTDAANLVTACWRCNARKGNLSLDDLGMTLHDPAETEWDGLTSLYPSLWEAAGRPKPNAHRPWLRAFAAVSGH